jgi:hypothetical protein
MRASGMLLTDQFDGDWEPSCGSVIYFGHLEFTASDVESVIG